MRVWQMLAAFERKQSVCSTQKQHIREEDLERFALDAIDELAQLPVALHTRECAECRKKLEAFQFLAARLQERQPAGVPVTDSERRADPRYKVKEPAIISASRPSDFEPLEGYVIDVSEFGLRILGTREIYKGSDVRVRVENAVVFGRVRYSRRVGEAFESGIETEQVIVRSEAAQLAIRTGSSKKEISREPVEILLVEDNPADVKLTKVMLQDIAVPHYLTVASDGAMALEMLNLAEPKPDVVLLDLNLPKVNGFDVLRHIRNAQALRTTRVIILSGSSAAHDMQRAEELGVEAYIQKPEQFDQYAEVGSRIGTLIDRAYVETGPSAGGAEIGASMENQTLMELLKQRFSDVTMRSDGTYEIDRRILLSTEEAEALVGNQVTLEEILIYRNRPSHLMPEHVRRALRPPEQ